MTFKCLQQSIDHDSWTETGGTIGSIQYMRHCLIVTQNWKNQEKVRSLLAALHAAETTRLVN